MESLLVETKIGELAVISEIKNETIVFLNGAGVIPAYENFQSIIRRLPKEVGFIALDFPNSGRSPLCDQKGFDINDVAQAVLEVLETLRINSYYLCIHSVSGFLALNLLNQSDSCKGLISIEPTTYSVLFGKLSRSIYPEFLEQEKIAEKAGGNIAYLQSISRQWLSSTDHERMWEIASQIMSDISKQDKDFQAYCQLLPEDIKYASLPNGIPHTLFTQNFRLMEYQKSEYYNDRTSIIAGGDCHYLQWEQAEKIAQAITDLSKLKSGL